MIFIQDFLYQFGSFRKELGLLYWLKNLVLKKVDVTLSNFAIHLSSYTNWVVILIIFSQAGRIDVNEFFTLSATPLDDIGEKT